MNYIKDTDFLPRVKDVSNDVYKLLYGVVKLRVETKIYDTITIMCRRYPDTPLRRAKINAWKSATLDTISRLEAHKGEKEQVYIPYFELLCSVESLLSLYRFTLGVLNEMLVLDRTPDYRRGTSKEAIQLFYPIPPFVNILRDFGRKCVKDKQIKGDVEAAIEKELEERGLIESSTMQAADTFDKIFYGGENKPKFSIPDDDDAPSREEVVDKVVKTGFLYYALKHYFEIVDKKQFNQDYVFGRLLTAATYRIANGIMEPNSEIKETKSNVYYQYANKRFQKGGASKETITRVQELTKRFIE